MQAEPPPPPPPKLNLRDEKFGLRVDYNTGHFGNWSGYYNFDDNQLPQSLLHIALS